MSRGWESKDVESQIDSAEADRRRKAAAPVRTAEQLAFDAKRESLELSRQRVLRDMEAARHPRHKEQLKRALAHLDGELAKLGTST